MAFRTILTVNINIKEKVPGKDKLKVNDEMVNKITDTRKH